jgi:protein MpaA
LQKEMNFLLPAWAVGVMALGSMLYAEARAETADRTVHTSVKEKFCQEVNSRFKKFNWNKIICKPETWNYEEKYTSAAGNPLFFREFKPKDASSTTLVMCGVHGNEPSSVYLCVHLAREMMYDNPQAFAKSHVIIAPLVNPDGFLKVPPTRQNERGVDLNRNFPTKDFADKAVTEWRNRTQSNKGKFPGEKGGSEIETQFQMMLIERFKPQKIVSIHAPYGWLDFDSPEPASGKDELDGFDFKEMQSKYREIAVLMSQKSRNFQMKSFGVFPGSLGNYAAKERGIPVYTLELPSSDPRHGEEYWKQMKNAIRAAIQFHLVKISKQG